MNLIPYCGYCGSKVGIFASRCPQCTSWLNKPNVQSPEYDTVDNSLKQSVAEKKVQRRREDGMVFGAILGTIVGFAYSMSNMAELGFFGGFFFIVKSIIIGMILGVIFIPKLLK